MAKSNHLQYNIDSKEWIIEEVFHSGNDPFVSNPRLAGSEDHTYIACYNNSIEEGKKQIYKYLLQWLIKEREYLDNLEKEAKSFLKNDS